MTTPHGLIRLRNAASSARGAAFDSCGLILTDGSAWPKYWCTPENVTVFAHTGGDGVHYSYLEVSKISEDICPIVMTVPMADSEASRCNVVVAESFEEFFSVGYYVGWFFLEQLLYDRSSAIEYLAKPDSSDGQCSHHMAFIREALAIQLAPLTDERLLTLRSLYANRLRLPESENVA